MLTDIHAIAGYLIASWLYEKNSLLITQNTKGSSILASVLKASSSNSYVNRWKSLEWVVIYLGRKKWSRYIRKVITSILEPIIPSSFESKYIVVGCILANLPDIDIFINFIIQQISYAFQRSGISLNVKPPRRAWTHSLIINAAATPFIALIVKFVILGSRRVTFRNALALTSLSILSHQILDYITCYGVGFLYPSIKKFYTLGVQSEWDFLTYVYFYTWFSIMRWRKETWRKSRIMLFGTIGYLAILIWKRAMLSEVYKKAHHYINRLKTQKHPRFPGIKGSITTTNLHVWLQPSNVILGRYTVLAYDSSRQKIFRCNVFNASKLLSLINYIRDWILYIPRKNNGRLLSGLFGTWIRIRPDFRVSSLSQDMGYLQAIPAPKESYESLPILLYNREQQQSSNRKKKTNLLATLIINQYSPTILLVIFYHAIAFLINKRRNVTINI